MEYILATLAFYVANPGLHSFSKTDFHTRRAIMALESRGYLRVFWDTNQATYTGKITA